MLVSYGTCLCVPTKKPSWSVPYPNLTPLVRYIVFSAHPVGQLPTCPRYSRVFSAHPAGDSSLSICDYPGRAESVLPTMIVSSLPVCDSPGKSTVQSLVRSLPICDSPGSAESAVPTQLVSSMTRPSNLFQQSIKSVSMFTQSCWFIDRHLSIKLCSFKPIFYFFTIKIQKILKRKPAYRIDIISSLKCSVQSVHAVHSYST